MARPRKEESLKALEAVIRQSMPALAAMEDGSLPDPAKLDGYLSGIVVENQAEVLCELLFYGYTKAEIARLLHFSPHAVDRYTKTPHFEYTRAEVWERLKQKFNQAMFRKVKNAAVEVFDDALKDMKKTKNGFLKQRIREWIFKLVEELEGKQPSGGRSAIQEVFKQLRTQKNDDGTTTTLERTVTRTHDAPGVVRVDGAGVGGGDADGVADRDGGEERPEEVLRRDGGGGLLAGGDIINVEPEPAGSTDGAGDQTRTDG